MAHYQERGSVNIQGISATGRLFTSGATLAGTETSIFFACKIRITQEDNSGTDYLLRYGTSASPGFCLRNRANLSDLMIGQDCRAAGGTNSIISIGDLTVGTDYAVVYVWNAAGLSTSDHPDITAGDNYAVYIFDLSTRTPTPTLLRGNTGPTAAMDAEAAGLEIRSQAALTDYLISDVVVAPGTAGTKADAYAFGQRTKDVANFSFNPKHYWRLDLYDTGNAATAAPSGEEAYALQDQGTGGADMLATVATSWTQTMISQEITEDPAVTEATTVVRQSNLGRIKKAIESSKGARFVFCGDSFNRPDLSSRGPSAFVLALLDEGYDITAFTGYLRTGSGTRVYNCSVASLTGATGSWFCNAANEGTFTNNPGASTDRYGLPMGGIYEVESSSATPTLGASGEIIGFTLKNTPIGSTGQVWFEDGDQLYARVPFYVADNNNFVGTCNLVTAAGTVAHDMSSATSWRQFYSDGVAWSTILAGTGGAKVQMLLNSYKTDLDLGTSGTSRTISVRVPTASELSSGLQILPACPVVWKGTAGVPDLGPNKIYLSFLGDNSASWIDFYDDAIATVEGSKKNSNEQLINWLEVTTLDPAQDVVFVKFIATESAGEATAITQDQAFLDRVKTVCSAAGITGDVYVLLVGQWFHSVDNDSVANDRQHITDWNAAAVSVATSNPTEAAAWSGLDYTGWYVGNTDEDAVTAYSLIGYGESIHIGNDATVSTRMNSEVDWLDTSLLHPNTDAGILALMSGLVADIAASTVPVDGTIIIPSGKYIPAVALRRR